MLPDRISGLVALLFSCASYNIVYCNYIRVLGSCGSDGFAREWGAELGGWSPSFETFTRPQADNGFSDLRILHAGNMGGFSSLGGGVRGVIG